MFLSTIVIYAGVFITCVLAVNRPFYGLVGYYVLSFMRPHDIYWYALGGSRLSFYIAAVTIFSAFLHYNSRKEDVPRSNPFLAFFIFFSLAAFNSYFFSVNMAMSHPYLILLLKLMMMSLITITVVQDIKEVRVLMWLLVISFGVLAIRANHQYFIQDMWLIESPGEPGRTDRLDNNGFAMQFVMALPIAFFLFFTEAKAFYVRWIGPFTIPFMIHAIILTYSRGGFIGMGVVLINCVFYLKNKKWALLAAILFLVVVFRLQGQQSQERMESVFDYEEDPSVTSRFEAWEAGMNMLVNNPLMGVGIGNFETQARFYNTEIKRDRAAHNAFLHIGGEMGFPGFLVYLAVLLFAFYFLWKIRTFYKPTHLEQPHFYYATALRTTLFGFITCAIFLSLNYLELYYFVIAIIGALTNIYRRDRLKLESQN